MECPGIHLPDVVVLQATRPSLGSRVLSSSSLPQREGRVRPPYTLAFKCERGWGLEFTFGTDFTLSQAQREEEMPFHRSPGLRSLHFLLWDLPFLGHLSVGRFTQPHPLGLLCLLAQQDGPRGAAVRYGALGACGGSQSPAPLPPLSTR